MRIIRLIKIIGGSACLLSAGCAASHDYFHARDLPTLHAGNFFITPANVVHKLGYPSEAKLSGRDYAWTYYFERVDPPPDAPASAQDISLSFSDGGRLHAVTYYFSGGKLALCGALQEDNRSDNFRVLRNDNPADLERMIEYTRSETERLRDYRRLHKDDHTRRPSDPHFSLSPM